LVDERSKKYAHWMLEHACHNDPKKIVGAKILVNRMADGFGIFGMGKMETKCSGMDFATGNIALHGGEYPNEEVIYCQRVHSITIPGHSEVVIPQLF
jgi:hypothetical protein